MRPSVLLIVDNDDVRMHLAELLCREGYHCHQAVNGIDALAVLDEGGRFDCIVLDLDLRRNDARSFRAAQMKTPKHRHIPVVAIAVDAEEVASLGADLVPDAPNVMGEIVVSIMLIVAAHARPTPLTAHHYLPRQLVRLA